MTSSQELGMKTAFERKVSCDKLGKNTNLIRQAKPETEKKKEDIRDG